jgi:hypothetical protein
MMVGMCKQFRDIPECIDRQTMILVVWLSVARGFITQLLQISVKPKL